MSHLLVKDEGGVFRLFEVIVRIIRHRNGLGLYKSWGPKRKINEKRLRELAEEITREEEQYLKSIGAN